MSKYYIQGDNLAPRFPLMPTLFWWMFLDYIKAPEWVFGAIGLCMLFLWFAFFHAVIKRSSIDILKDKE